MYTHMEKGRGKMGVGVPTMSPMESKAMQKVSYVKAHKKDELKFKSEVEIFCICK